MSRFAVYLRDARDKLDLPQPAKSRILLEIASDLEDLYQHYVDEGLPEPEAARRATDRLEASEEALAELVRIHQTPVRRFLDRLSAQARARWEKVALWALLLVFLVLAGPRVIGTPLIRQASAFVWPSLAITGVVALLALAQVYKLYIKREHRVTGLRRPLAGFLYLAAVNLAVGGSGFLVELYRAARRALLDVDLALPLFVQWLLSGSAMLIVCLTTTLATGVIWFILLAKVASIEAAEVACLLED